MNVFVISLERLPERVAFMQSGLTQLGVRYELFSAVDAARGEHEAVSRYDEAACRRQFGAPLIPAEIGAFASHYLLWKQCVETNSPITILEDDVELLAGFPRALALADERIAEHRLIRLSGYYERPYRLIENIDGTYRLVRFARGPAGAQCYSLAPSGAAALLASASKWVEPVDLYIDRFWKHGLTSKALIPFQAHERDRTTLPQAIGDRTFKRKGAAKWQREWRRVADQIARRWYNLIYR